MNRIVLLLSVVLALGCGGKSNVATSGSDGQKPESEASQKKREPHVLETDELGKIEVKNAKQQITESNQHVKERQPKSEPSDDLSPVAREEKDLSDRAVAELRLMTDDQKRNVARLMVKAGQSEEFDEEDVAFLDKFPAMKEKIGRYRMFSELFPSRNNPRERTQKSE